MATPAKKPLPKQARPTPGPGDTNTPQQVAQVNAAQAAVDQASPSPAAAPQAVPASSPQAPEGAPGAGDESGPNMEWATAEDYVSHGPNKNIPDSRAGLTGPTDRPQEHVSTGSSVPSSNRPPVDPTTLAAMAKAAADPSAPPELKNMYASLLFELSH